MAAPLIPFAGAIATFFGSLFAGLVSAFATFFTRKTAVALALGAFLVGGWLALQAAMYAAWQSLNFVMPAGLDIPLQIGLYLMPSNFAVCVEIVILAKIGRWLWDGQADWARAVAMAG